MNILLNKDKIPIQLFSYFDILAPYFVKMSHFKEHISTCFNVRLNFSTN